MHVRRKLFRVRRLPTEDEREIIARSCYNVGMKRILSVVVLMLLLALSVLVCLFWRQAGGATHGEILAAVREEGELTRQFIDLRLKASETKLDRIEGKLDRLIQLVDVPLPDGMRKSAD